MLISRAFWRWSMTETCKNVNIYEFNHTGRFNDYYSIIQPITLRPTTHSCSLLRNWPLTLNFSNQNARPYCVYHRSRDSAVGIATGYGLDDRGDGVRFMVGSRSPSRPDWFWGPPNLLSNGYRGALSPGVKRQGREADQSPPASAEVKKMWYTSTPPHAFMA
jgi:hypothetical protein